LTAQEAFLAEVGAVEVGEGLREDIMGVEEDLGDRMVVEDLREDYR
jgi:hypothetical protein